MPEQLTLYYHKPSPYSKKIELALVEANAPYKAYEVDLLNKPEWFAKKVHPVGKVPVVTYGGPDVDPEDPSPLAARIAESNVILEFIADLYPDSGLMPKDHVLRAYVRVFIDATIKHVEEPLYAFFVGTEPSYENVLKGIEFVQGLLEEGREFAVGGHFTIADACITSPLTILKIITESDIGGFSVGMGYKLGEELKGPKFVKFMKYVKRVLERPSLKQVYDEEHAITFFRTIKFAERAQ
ncbi:hypothetical protein DFH29DRAFT_1081382 [Suillus ampliporus]|nr:hypothetical protein DFH29DRAFT_1081382 [Suillus ampliporus]